MVEGGGVSGVDDCERGAMCWSLDEQGMGTCIAHCAGSLNEPICAEQTFCSSAIQSEGVLNLCLFACDPLVQDCDEGEECTTNWGMFYCAPDWSGDMGAANDPCEFANACDAGLVCIDTAWASSACMQGSTGCCQPFCEFVEGQDGECPNADQKCVQWFDPKVDEIPEGYEDVGVCAIP
jgi:hypothetical protein